MLVATLFAAAGVLHLSQAVAQELDSAPGPLLVAPNAAAHWQARKPTESPTAKSRRYDYISTEVTVGQNTGRKLKWRGIPSAPTTQQQPYVQAAAHEPLLLAPATGEVPQPIHVEPRVRTVAEVRPADPFDDPFGDKPRDRGNSVLTRQSSPTALQPPATEPEEFQPMNPVPPREALPQPRNDDDRPDVLPQPKDTADCAKDKNCETGARSIRDISLDITAPVLLSFDVRDALWESEGSDGLRQKYLDPNYTGPLRGEARFQNKSRVWKNRNNEVVAEGRLVQYANAKAVVESSGGQRVQIAFHDLSEDDLCYLTSWWRLPNECTLTNEAYAHRGWMPATMTWTASALCHKPLYFEDIQLERYGHSAGPIIQPFKSAAHFFLNIAVVPYRMGINPPYECQYALGYYRPGDCAPWMIEPVPISLRGAAWQSAAVMGLIYTIP